MALGSALTWRSSVLLISLSLRFSSSIWRFPQLIGAGRAGTESTTWDLHNDLPQAPSMAVDDSSEGSPFCRLRSCPLLQGVGSGITGKG